MSTVTTSARSSSSMGFPFTASQWQELEHQALIFKYMVSGMPIPPDLLYTVRRSLDSSLMISSKLLLHQPQYPEPGRCRRTDGKKWRCSKAAYPDSKYCERHMHRGRNRSRKPVEQQQLIITSSSTTTTPPTAIPMISSITKNNTTPSPSSLTSHHSFSSNINHPIYTPFHHPFIYPHSSSSRSPPGAIDHFSSQENSTNFLLESGPYSHARRGHSYDHHHGRKEEVDEHEHAFFCEASGTIRNLDGTSSSSQLVPPVLTMGSSPLDSHMKQQKSPYLQLQSLNHDNYNNNNMNTTASRQQKQAGQQQQQYYPMDRNDDHHQKKVMHHFFDEWPPKDNKDSCSWLDNNNNNDHDHHKLSKIQLSISVPNSSSSSQHDFIMIPNGTS
ncbi:hypothetical protein ACH5RR_003997 [Cinchona calisaya]|uniref:Growth-regulating factor n=1 Tax=Cinchona calisaya TaxID=153742 RepID=A0ABD3AWS1_9GENT